MRIYRSPIEGRVGQFLLSVVADKTARTAPWSPVLAFVSLGYKPWGAIAGLDGS